MGDRCEVEPGAKRGTVKFVGKAEALGRGFWVGVQYDEPLGKHDGMYVHSQTMLVTNLYPVPKSSWLLVTSNNIPLEKQFILFDLLGSCCRVKGVRFFECPQGHGAIVRPEKVKVHTHLPCLAVYFSSLLITFSFRASG